MIQQLLDWASQRGYRIAWGPESLVEDACREISARTAGLEIDGQLFEDQLKDIVAGRMNNASRTVVIIAKPRSAHLVHFDIDGKDLAALLPPTYFRYRATFEEVRLDLAANGLPGAQVEFLTAPLKATASRLGLVYYGRNNISYAPGLGSYIQLCGYLTDAKLPERNAAVVGPGSLLPECEGCSICMHTCFNGAITEDRVLLRAERCLTYLNENPGSWPEWVNPKAHNSLLGCLDCQRACPVNPELTVEDTGVRFSASETKVLLSGDATMPGAGTENGIRSKLAWLGQPAVESLLGRNLRALMQSGNSVPAASGRIRQPEFARQSPMR